MTCFLLLCIFRLNQVKCILMVGLFLYSLIYASHMGICLPFLIWIKQFTKYKLIQYDCMTWDTYIYWPNVCPLYICRCILIHHWYNMIVWPEIYLLAKGIPAACILFKGKLWTMDRKAKGNHTHHQETSHSQCQFLAKKINSPLRV